MARPNSMDLRERAMDRLAAGESSYAVAAISKVAVSSALKWPQRKRRTGSVAPGRMGGNRPLAIGGAHRDGVLAEVDGAAHARWRFWPLGLRRAVSRSIPPASGAFCAARARALKKTALPAEQIARPKLTRRREQRMQRRSAIDPKRLVFLDETWVILRQAQDQYGTAPGLGRPQPTACRPCPAWPLKNHDLRRRAAP